MPHRAWTGIVAASLVSVVTTVGHVPTSPDQGVTRCASTTTRLAGLGRREPRPHRVRRGRDTTGGGDDGGDYPSGTVEMYVGADPGGSSDLISRAVSKGLTDELGASFPVINKSGSNGALAAGRGRLRRARRLDHRDPERLALRDHSARRRRGRGDQHRRLRGRPGRLARRLRAWSPTPTAAIAQPRGPQGGDGEGHLRHDRRRHRLPALLRAAARARRSRRRGRAVRRRCSGPDRRPRRPGRHRLPADRRGDREHRVGQDRAADRLRLRARRVPARRARPRRSRASTSRSRSTAS